jgi:hypothetical protein
MLIRLENVLSNYSIVIYRYGSFRVLFTFGVKIYFISTNILMIPMCTVCLHCTKCWLVVMYKANYVVVLARNKGMRFV